jgi:hypothetical protein
MMHAAENRERAGKAILPEESGYRKGLRLEVRRGDGTHSNAPANVLA